MGGLTASIGSDRLNPRSRSRVRLRFHAFGFRCRRQLDGGDVGRGSPLGAVGRGSSNFTCQRPSGAFSINSCAPMRLNLSLVVDKPAPTTFASNRAEARTLAHRREKLPLDGSRVSGIAWRGRDVGAALGDGGGGTGGEGSCPFGFEAAGASHWARSSRMLSGSANVRSIASRTATSSSRVIGMPLRSLRNDKIAGDRHWALPAENIEQD